MNGAEISDGGLGTECGDVGNVDIPPGAEFESCKACKDDCNTACSNFDPILNGVIQPLLVKYESSNLKALLEGYKRETKRRTHPLCLREVECYLVSAAVEWAADRADYLQFCSRLIIQSHRALTTSESRRVDPNQTLTNEEYYEKLWDKVCDNSQVLPVSEGSEALLAELTNKSWLSPISGRNVENTRKGNDPPDSAYVSTSRHDASCAPVPGPVDLDILKNCHVENVRKEKEFADSAYVSASRHEGSCAPVPGPFELDDPETCDSRTKFSHASSVSDGRIVNYLSVLCEEIHGALQQTFDPLKWAKVSEKLPELLKAFAIKLGNAEGSKQHWEIMYFVYRRHNDIASHLQSLFGCKTADPEKGGPRAMSLEDKMLLWDQKTMENTPTFQPGELFQGISEEPIIRTSNVEAYKSLILENPAYGWLLSSLKQNSILEMENSAQTRIREKVLRQLPTGNMSRKSAPQIHHCRIDFQLDPAAYRHHLPGDYSNPVRDLDAKRVLVASSSYVQVVTVKQYFEQTWSFNGPSFLDAFLVIANLAPGKKYSGELPDKTRLSANAANKGFQLTVSGSAASAAECAEQLAWLMAALESSLRNSLATCHPFIESIPEQVPSQRVESTAHFSICQNVVQKPALAPALREWQEYLGMPPLVVGFPVLARPKGCDGLEIHSLADLLDFCKASDVTLVEGATFIEGQKTVLVASQTIGNMVIWMNADRGDINPSGFSRMTISVKDRLEGARHIYDPRPSKESLRFGDDVSDSESIVFDQDGQRLSVSRNSSSEYLDSDILSLDESSDSMQSLSLGESGYQVLDGCFERLWSEFRGASPGFKQESGSSGNSSLKPESNTNDTTGFNANQTRRRKRALPPDGGEDGAPSPSKPPSKRLNSEAEGKQWACPFWKKNADHHRACFRYKLMRVQDVKQHLVRRHTPKFYCECCLKIFADEIQHHEHVTHANGDYCKRDPAAELKGISHQQSRELSTKSKKASSEIERWYHIWYILFPGIQAPRSPYMDSELSEDMCAFHEFFDRRGQSIIAEELENDPVLASTPHMHRHHIQNLFVRGLSRVFDSWRTTRGPVLGSDAVQIPFTPSGLDRGRSSLGTSNVLVGEPSMASSDYVSIPVGMPQGSSYNRMPQETPYNELPQGSPYGAAVTQGSPNGNQSEYPPSSGFAFSYFESEASFSGDPNFCFTPGDLLQDTTEEYFNTEP
ncbi:unnamed protein product [Clonostachys byssicola]|uniref:C2H2-type domain-containing protein n=1 Tax=Clonostachys byssicola TaxID=160290 RepID=A0A9N9Y4N1_9HYPO|nr:unnamed protein product [Clonostachys byssicola]